MLELDGLNKSYGSLRALRDLSFGVRPGEIFGFVGSNGAGKSTAMRIVLGVLSADSGAVRWHGRPLDAGIRRQIGYMPEERGLYPRMKVGDQLTYLARLHGMSKQDAERSMKQWTETLSVAHRTGDEVIKLSLGNQQRVQLAAALVHGPRILVLDEPFSGLDPVAVDVMSGVLRDQARAGVPVLFSSHQLDLVERICDRVGIIRDGEMVALGDLDTLRRTDRTRWRIEGPPAAAWVAGVPGVRVVAAEGARTIVEVAGTAGDRGTTGDIGATWDGGTTRGHGTTEDLDTTGHAGTTWDMGTSGVAGTPEAAGQAILAAALAAGPVHEFALERPTLVELYRDVVSTEEGPSDALDGGREVAS